MEFYTESDIRNMLQLGDRQTHALMQTEGFPAIKIGRDYRIEKAAFENWILSTKGIVLDYRGISKPREDKSNE